MSGALRLACALCLVAFVDCRHVAPPAAGQDETAAAAAPTAEPEGLVAIEDIEVVHEPAVVLDGPNVADEPRISVDVPNLESSPPVEPAATASPPVPPALAVAPPQLGEPTTPFSPYTTVLGNDPVDARSCLMGSDDGSAYGMSGLGVFGTGAGGEGSNIYGFGLGDTGQMGQGYGTGDSVGFGASGGTGGGGDASGADLADRTGRSPDLRLGDATTYGGLSKEAIRRIVQQAQPDVRRCYEAALRRDPSVAGRVTVRLVIAADGLVQGALATGDETGDEALVDCLLDAVSGLTFPAADRVTVVGYPFQLQPSEVVVLATDEGVTAEPEGDGGTLRAKDSDGRDIGEFPLRHTEVEAEVSGYLARTAVEQTYENTFDEAIEAVYVFPLPAMGAVHDFLMEIGDRKIVGIVRPREEAQHVYEEARARGQTASLLSQERPNIFTQSVANLEPGGQVKIRLTYLEKLAYERGRYEWVFPMVVGPRYIPGRPADASAGDDRAPPTAPPLHRSTAPAAPTPPVLEPGERSGHDIGLTVKLDGGVPLHDVDSVNHHVTIEEVSDSQRVVSLSPRDVIPNKDFVLRWKVDDDETQFGVLTHKGDDGGYLALMMQPPVAPDDDQVTPRELTFVLDVSGSMMGLPADTAKAVIDRSLDKLRPDDQFNIVFFSGGNAQLWESPRRGSSANLQEARDFLAALEAGGGTDLVPALRRALRAEHDASSLQMYVLLTDGYVGNEEEILRLVKTERGEARFFAFGIGSSVNRYLIDGVGEFGGGASEVVFPHNANHAEEAAGRLFELIDSPVLVDVAIDWNGLPVEDAYPGELPDLFAGGTINVVARYTESASGTIYVEGRVGDQPVRVPVQVQLPETDADDEALAPIWARWRIAELDEQRLTAGEDESAELERQITELAVDYRLVSAFTSFVAVDDSRIVGEGHPAPVFQPIEMPDGVSYEGVFGGGGVRGREAR
ncbi:MAG: AgmX/PglI C-terminal domain-containing protein [Deltaproteobacteria bacterium]|nr:AgmX/PglI C-terminal domain-containing protein [Deltaproteobacteria bacterium]